MTDRETGTWPYADWKLHVGRLLELGDGVRMGLVRVADDGTAAVQVFRPEAPQDAVRATLRRGEAVDCLGRAVTLTDVGRGETGSWITVDVA
jgi:hypothetical protein